MHQMIIDSPYARPCFRSLLAVQEKKTQYAPSAGFLQATTASDRRDLKPSAWVEQPHANSWVVPQHALSSKPPWADLVDLTAIPNS
jgi:hypothetical protein